MSFSHVTAHSLRWIDQKKRDEGMFRRSSENSRLARLYRLLFCAVWVGQGVFRLERLKDPAQFEIHKMDDTREAQYTGYDLEIDALQSQPRCY